MPKERTEEDVAERWILRCRRDPSYFVQTAFGVTPSKQQMQALKAIAKYGSKVSIRSGHGTGKTTVLAWILLWYLFCHSDCRIPATAPTGHQLYDLLWAEASKWLSRMRVASMRFCYVAKSTHIEIKGFEKTRFAVAVTARKEQPEALAGFHATNLLYILDEASGIPDKVFEVSEGALTTPGARVIMAGNPTRMSGYFQRSHNADKEHWTCLHWDSEKSEMVDPAFVERMATRYGRDSNVFRIRVQGNFPIGGDDIVIGLHLIQAARQRDTDASGLRRAGCDVARFGDDSTTFVIRPGNRVTFMDSWRKLDLAQSADRILGYFNQNLFDCIFVDTIGVGAGLADILRRMNKFPVYDVNVSEAAQSDQYMRKRDELWFRCRDWFEGNDATIPDDHRLSDQLENELCTVTYSFAPGGKLKVQGKDEIKEQNEGISPDMADALCLTFADTSSMVSAGAWNRGAV